ncbi:TPA: hypothetical protein ACGVB5_004762, partial [Vibrio vulnificus]
ILTTKAVHAYGSAAINGIVITWFYRHFLSILKGKIFTLISFDLTLKRIIFSGQLFNLTRFCP